MYTMFPVVFLMRCSSYTSWLTAAVRGARRRGAPGGEAGSHRVPGKHLARPGGLAGRPTGMDTLGHGWTPGSLGGPQKVSEQASGND